VSACVGLWKNLKDLKEQKTVGAQAKMQMLIPCQSILGAAYPRTPCTRLSSCGLLVFRGTSLTRERPPPYPLYLQFFLRKGVSLGHVGRNQNIQKSSLPLDPP